MVKTETWSSWPEVVAEYSPVCDQENWFSSKLNALTTNMLRAQQIERELHAMRIFPTRVVFAPSGDWSCHVEGKRKLKDMKLSGSKSRDFKGRLLESRPSADEWIVSGRLVGLQYVLDPSNAQLVAPYLSVGVLVGTDTEWVPINRYAVCDMPFLQGIDDVTIAAVSRGGGGPTDIKGVLGLLFSSRGTGKDLHEDMFEGKCVLGLGRDGRSGVPDQILWQNASSEDSLESSSHPPSMSRTAPDSQPSTGSSFVVCRYLFLLCIQNFAVMLCRHLPGRWFVAPAAQPRSDAHRTPSLSIIARPGIFPIAIGHPWSACS